MRFVPLFDRVLIKSCDNNKANNLGLVLSDISKSRPTRGEVVAVGTGVNFDYSQCEIFCHVGDMVEFNPYAGAEVELDGEKYIVIRQIDIVGVYDEREDDC